MKTYLLASTIALFASCACFASANASGETPAGRPYLMLVDTTVCLVPPAPGSPCLPWLNLNPPYPRKRTTRATAAGDSAPVLAESPRNMIVTSPGQTGQADVTVKENGTEAKEPLRNIPLSLPGPKTSLKRGQNAPLTIPAEDLYRPSTPSR